MCLRKLKICLTLKIRFKKKKSFGKKIERAFKGPKSLKMVKTNFKILPKSNFWLKSFIFQHNSKHALKLKYIYFISNLILLLCKNKVKQQHLIL